MESTDHNKRLSSDFYQAIRLVDVFVIGPGMIYISYIHKKNLILSTGFLITGIATILFNGKNYLEIQKSKRHGTN